jgi:exodeoxyribonuclease V alpha subunit
LYGENVLVEIEGTIEDIIFSNEVNGYTVCDINIGKENCVAVGYMPFINVGETVKASGKWVSHPEYGDQFKVELYEKVFPQTEEAIEKYLSSGIIKGIGPITAARIVERFGSDALDIIGNKPQLLADIKGISFDKALKIGQAFEEQRGLKNVVMFLQEFGISPACCVKIYRAFGEKAVEKVRENPYCLSEEIFGIGFKTADRIAMSMGVDPTSKFRAASGIKYVLSQAAADGHTYATKPKLIEYVSSLLGTNIPDIESVLISLIFDKSVVSERQDEEDRIYLSTFFNAELGVCRKLAELAGMSFNTSINDFESKLDEIQKEEGVILAEMQKKAVMEAVNSGLLVITGGPGTGKTTIIKSIIGVLMNAGLKVLLAAPTGRAAKRMSEATGFEARTIHRLLEIGYLGDGSELVFQRNEENPIDADVIIIDEMSMVDVLLMNHLLKAVPRGARLILVGDINQLPSVGAGNVLKDIIESGLAKTICLTDIFRQAQQSMIIVNAHRINNGEMPHLNIKEKDFFFVTRNSSDSIVKTVVDLCQRRLPETYSYDPMRQIQVLSPAKKGPTGVLNLNTELQSILNPAGKSKAEKLSREYILREGDRVMQVKNNYNLRWVKYGQANIDGLGVFNGDLGIISRIDENEHILEILFDDDKLVEYEFGILDEIEPAFAITIHKSQGSEFPVVVMPVFSGPQVLMTRNLLYTAVTRARELVVLVGDETSLARMVENERETFRNSGLIEKLKKVLQFADI